MRLMDSPSSFTGPVNLGNPVEFTMLELAELVLAETGSSSSQLVQPGRYPQDDPRQRPPEYYSGEGKARMGAKDKFGRRPQANGRLLSTR